MSSIPNSAIPHAGPAAEAEEEGGLSLKQRVTGLVRDNPRTAIAAGAAVAAGVATAAVVRARRGKGAGAKAGGSAGAKSPARKKPKSS